MSEFDVKIDYYSVLGVGPTASQDEILKAYHALAAKYHPDKHQGNDLEALAREKLTQINAAFGVVGNPERRARYDAARRGAGSPFAGGGASGGQAGAGSGPGRTILIIGGVLLALFLVWSIPPIRLGVARLFRLIIENWKVSLIMVAVVAAIFLVPRLLRRKK